jgi:two-component system sensor histidine kinase/response regulator
VRKRILVVEDDAVQRDVLAQFLNDQRFYVETAIDGLDAVQRARLGWFDVIFMDCRLPEVDGIAASRLIADLTRDHGSPRIIALTGWPELARQPTDGAGSVFFAVEPKPWDPKTLLRHIEDAEEPCPPADLRAHEAAWRQDDGAWPPPRAVLLHDDDSRDGPRILLVEDDDGPRALVSAALTARGYRVDEAQDGLQAVLMMGETTYAAAIIDYALPKMNGAAAARLVQDLLARADRPRLIALTASPDLMQDKIDGLASSFNEIVAKGDGLDAVLAAVERCVGGARLGVVQG